MASKCAHEKGTEILRHTEAIQLIQVATAICILADELNIIERNKSTFFIQSYIHRSQGCSIGSFTKAGGYRRMQIWCAQGSKTQIQEPRAITKPRMGGAAQAMLGHAGWASGTEEQLGRFLVMSCLINSILFFPERDPVRPCN